MTDKQAMTYAQAGVDIDAGNRAVQLMKEHVKTTARSGVLSGIGGFGGFFALDTAKYKEPVLVSGTDGVGTKLRIAMLLDRHDTIGIDAVAMCVNDILVQGAEPLFFLDYLAVGKLLPEKAAAIVSGVAEGCRQSGCALIGGETAEMPGFYGVDEYDIAGFAVGAVERSRIITGAAITPGDKVIGLYSTGLHSNGYSLVRKVLLEDAGLALNEYREDLGATLGDVLLTPTRIYVRALLPLIEKYEIKGLAHITGGGLLENIPRVLPPDVNVVIQQQAWQVPPIFKLIQELGGVAAEEMYRTFNMGIGMTAIVAAQDADAILQQLNANGSQAVLLGEVVPGSQIVEFVEQHG